MTEPADRPEEERETALATMATLAYERGKEIERLVERLMQAEKVAKAAGALISADINVHPMMSRDEAVSSSYWAFAKAVNEYRSALPAAGSPDFDPRRAQKEE